MKKANIADSPRWERRRDSRPSEIVAAALMLFVERGFAATRLDDIAQLAGVSKGTLYLYFDGKEELFKAVVRAGLAPLLAQTEALVAHHRGPTAQLLRGIVAGWWLKVGSGALGGILKLVISEAGNFPGIARFYHDEVILRSRRLIGAVLQRGIDRGELRSFDVETMQQVVIAPMLMLCLWQHSLMTSGATLPDAKNYLENYFDLILRGLLNPESASGEHRS